ncbi:MAG: diguanylate cyclase [Firmicutes bacterium]|nr:diguanylate cyclase [Bacillota bacterium]
MILMAALAGSVYMLLPLFLAFTSPDFLIGRRGETLAVLLFTPCLALFAVMIPYHRSRHQTAPDVSWCGAGRWSVLCLPLGVAAGLWAALVLLREYANAVALAVMNAPGLLLGAWAWAMWWRNHYLQARLKEVSELYRHRDAITGLLNHYAVYEALEQEILEASRSKHLLSLIRLDLDRFALFNATHGHRAGDELLRQIGQSMKASLSPGAVVGRYDADEFLIVLPDTTRSQAMAIARRLRERIRQETLIHLENGQLIPVTASIGVAEFPGDAASAEELLSVAEGALLTARQNGSGVADSQSGWRTRYQIQANGAFSTLEAMVIAIDNKDHYTRRHSEEVSEYALWIAEELGLSEEQKHVLRLGGLLHDVGKIGIPDEVLMKPGLLTAEEYEAMKQHTVLGAVMLSALPGMEKIAPLARSHHERWDGNGYPDGLAGEEIPLLARILTVADAFSAMTTDRPYRKGMDRQSALAELQRQRGKQFDPVVVDAFVAAVYRRANRESLEQDSLPIAA